MYQYTVWTKWAEFSIIKVSGTYTCYWPFIG